MKIRRALAAVPVAGACSSGDDGVDGSALAAPVPQLETETDLIALGFLPPADRDAFVEAADAAEVPVVLEW